MSSSLLSMSGQHTVAAPRSNVPSRNGQRASQAQPRGVPKWLQAGLLAIVSALLLSIFTGEIRDTDVNWHLKTGQYILETRGLPIPDPFSYTTAMSTPRYAGEEITRRVNLSHEWLSEVIMYLIYRVAGFPGLVLTRALLLVLVCSLVGWIVFRRTLSFYLAVSATLTSAGIVYYFQQSRPFLATFVCCAAVIAIFEGRRRLWLLPILFAFWANCHGGFFVGWLVCGAYSAEALVLRLRNARVANDRAVWIYSAAAIAASILNPNGLRIFQVLWFYRSSEIQTGNLEWQKPIFWEPGTYSFLLFGSLAVLLLSARRARLVDWLLYVGLAALSLMAVRNTIFIGLIGPVVIATYLPKWRRLPLAAAVLSTSTLLFADAAPAVANHNALALRLAEWQFPAGAADFVQTHHLRGRIFNNYEDGGYLIWCLWPNQRDFIDGRGLSEEVYSDYRRLLYGRLRDTETLLDKYSVQLVVLQGFDYLSGQVYPLAIDLSESDPSQWKLVYADSAALIFSRGNVPDLQALDRNAVLDSLEKQCSEHLRHEPFRPRCSFGLAELYAQRGDTNKASKWISDYLKRHNGPDPEAESISWSLAVTKLNNQALSREADGDTVAADQLFHQALTIAETKLGPNHPDTAGTLNNLGALLEQEGDYAIAEQLFRRTLSICEKTFGPDHPRTASSLDNLAGVLAAEGNYGDAERLYRQALSISEKALGQNDIETKTIQQDFNELLSRNAK